MKRLLNIMHHTAVIGLLMVVMTAPVRSQVDLKVGGGIGAAIPASDFGGTTLEYYSGTNYGLATGLNVHAKAKMGLAGFGLAGEIDYSSFGNTGNSEPGQGSVEITQSVMSVKVGPEFHFGIPAVPINPYIGANLALNRFSGETKFLGVSKVPSATYNVEEATRLGLGLAVGAEVAVGPFLSLDFNISYNLMNIAGSEWEDVNPSVNQRIDSYLSMNDSSDPLYAAGSDNHFVSNDRSVHSVLLTVSILFGL
jgi:opacity protein-like surface antigen